MRFNIKDLVSTISIKQSKNYANSFEIILNKIDLFKKFSSADVTLFMYPYSKELNADSFTIYPYEEYVKDVNSGRRSMYRELGNIGDNIFGIFLGIAISLIFWRFNRTELFSIESVVSIFAAYTIGKEFWMDLDNGLTSLTQKWKFSWRDKTYFYIKQDFGTIQRFWKLARLNKYKIDTVLAYQLDFMIYSNSKTVELFFEKKDFKSIVGDSTNLVSIGFNDKDQSILKKDNYMFGTKLIVTKNRIFWKSNIEIFQAVSKGEIGTLDNNENWKKNLALVRRTKNIGRLKWYGGTRFEKVNLLDIGK